MGATVCLTGTAVGVKVLFEEGGAVVDAVGVAERIGMLVGEAVELADGEALPL